MLGVFHYVKFKNGKGYHSLLQLSDRALEALIERSKGRRSESLKEFWIFILFYFIFISEYDCVVH